VCALNSAAAQFSINDNHECDYKTAECICYIARYERRKHADMFARNSSAAAKPGNTHRANAEQQATAARLGVANGSVQQ